MPQNWGKKMHGGQKRAPELREENAQGAKTCLRIGGQFCPGGIKANQILGRKMKEERGKWKEEREMIKPQIRI